jgi:hypothetical protein
LHFWTEFKSSLRIHHDGRHLCTSWHTCMALDCISPTLHAYHVSRCNGWIGKVPETAGVTQLHTHHDTPLRTHPQAFQRVIRLCICKASVHDAYRGRCCKRPTKHLIRSIKLATRPGLCNNSSCPNFMPSRKHWPAPMIGNCQTSRIEAHTTLAPLLISECDFRTLSNLSI